MNEQNEKHNPASYAELILLSADSTENEFRNQEAEKPKRLVSGMFSSISDAELITQRLIAESQNDNI